MGLQTNLIGRLMNTSLNAKRDALLPVFEAVVNAIQALEEKGNLTTTGHITLKIIRTSQLDLNGEHPTPEIVDFIIKDNGIGFNEKNMVSFETLDSDHKIKKGCRGIGRLLWLKAFENVDVSSIYKDKQGYYRERHFEFNAQHDIKEIADTASNEKTTGSTITLRGFKSAYRAGAQKTQDSIAISLLEHCLWYFVRPEGIPTIHIVDNGHTLNLSQIYDQCIHSLACPESIEIKGHPFELTHVKFRSPSTKKHILGLCAAGRLVEDKKLTDKTILGLYETMKDSNGTYSYACYVASPYLDSHVNAERTSFNLIDNNQPDLFQDISYANINEAVIKHVNAYLKDDLEANLKAGHVRVSQFISEKGPRYRSILPYIDEKALAIDPSSNDKKIEIHLHEQLMNVEQELLTQGHEVMAMGNKPNDPVYQDKLARYLKMAEDIKCSDLASYVSHRRAVLDTLEKAMQYIENDKYSREDFIHNLIMPMRKDSNEVGFDICNLWLIDERLAFHNYLGSDKTLNSMPITGDTSKKEPDLCCLQLYDNPILVSEQKEIPLPSLTLVELKRPMSSSTHNPIDQILNYLDRIREGTVKTAQGRLIPNATTIPCYCYIIADLTPLLIKQCKRANLLSYHNETGFFGFNAAVNAYFEVMSYDKLLHEAKNRNRAFFDKLGLPSN